MIFETSKVHGLQHRAADHKANWEEVFEQLPMAACMVDIHHSNIVHSNSAFKDFLSIYNLDQDEIPIPYALLQNGNQLFDTEYNLIRDNQKIHFLLSSIYNFELDQVKNTRTIFLKDITYLRNIETKLTLGHITHQQQNLIDQLKKSQEQAENANKNKSIFLANVSHEIRTPLTAILGFADLLKDAPPSDVEKNKFIETINRNGNALIKIIDDVLDLSKVEANCLELEKAELSPECLLKDIVQQFKEKAESKNISIILNIQNELPASILSDSVRIQQILSNLLNNAIKFTEKGTVTVEAQSSLLTSSIAVIEVRVIDTGIGLSKDQQERLFTPFSQAETSTTRKFGGTGLGLALSKHLAEALGGSLCIEKSEPNQGCTFTFKFSTELADSTDLTVRPAPSNSLSKSEFRPLAGSKILLAEDSLDNQYFLEKFLEKYGASVTTASNGREAIDLARIDYFDLILMDIEMPDIDGYEATRSLRAEGFTLPILALTAHAMNDERLKTKEAGCNGHVTKPIDTSLLLLELEKQLHSSKQKRH